MLPSSKPRFLLVLCLALALVGCAQPGMQGGFKRGAMTATNVLNVRTTAYTGSRNAIGGRLCHGSITSAASDWSEFPLGTRFRIRETGQVYEIDDYGSALIGTRTIDLCMPGNRAMHAWGVRNVTIDVLEWGSPRRSLEVLTPRDNRMARRMLVALRRQTQGIPEKMHKMKM
ncbi:MAG: 3D domain-containing protein [Verrucomicrobiota bacterium]